MSMHIDARPGEIAERIILVGDPFRAKHIAENWLDDAMLVNEKRMAYCYTGTYKLSQAQRRPVLSGQPVSFPPVVDQ